MLGLDSSVSFCLAVYLFAWAEVVALTEALSLFHAVSIAGYLVGELVLFAIAATLWARDGRPPPPRPRFALIAVVRAHPAVAALACVVGLAIVYEAVVGLSTPPTTLDELWYHLSRAAAWLGHGGLYRIPGGNAAENDYPPNAEIGVLYGFVFLHRETVAAIPQLVAQGAIVLAIFGLARRLGSSRAAALFAGLLFVTLSGVAVDAMTALNDIVVGSFVGAAAYFVLRPSERAALALGGLAVGLALGTKYTAFFALPVLLLLVVAVLPPRRLAILATWTTLGFAAVGSYGYVENVVSSHAVLGAGAREIGTSTASVTARGTISTMARNLYRFADLPGYRIKTAWLGPFERFGRDAFRALHIPTSPPEASTGGSPFSFEINVGSNTGTAWYGPLGWLLIIPLALVFGASWAFRRVGRVHGILALSLPLYLLVTAIVYRYTSNGRFFITPIVLTLPLAAAVYRYRPLASAVAVIASVTLLFALAYDADKPTGLGSSSSIWALSRAEAESIPLGPDAVDAIRVIDRLPSREHIGFDAPELYFGYVLYGPTLRRKLIPLSGRSPLTDAMHLGLRVVYLGPGIPVPAHGQGWKVAPFGSAGTLLTLGPTAH